VSPPIGEWDDDTAASSTLPHPAASSAVEAAIGRVDLRAAAAQAVGAAMKRRMDAIAAAAVDELLEPLMPELRVAADVAARQALDAPADLGGDEDEPPEPYFPDLMTFVTSYLTPMYRRSVSGSGTTWCPEWWNHAEGIARLEALWRAWEFLRLDPHTGMSVWFRDHADHHMSVLLNADGPFKGCKPAAHAERLEQLPTRPPADGRATLR
jgi:hypothetical protein